MFFRKFFLFLLFISFSFSLSANQKDQIITQLNNLNSLEFTFDQLVNEKLEKGSCLLEFPGKLKCEYFDNKQKDLVINNKRLAIPQKKYNKTKKNFLKSKIKGPHVYQHDLLYLRCLFLPSYQ